MDIEFGPQSVPFMIDIHRGVAQIPAFGRHQVIMHHAPVFARAVGGVPDPDDMTASFAQRGRHPIDVWYDRPRLGNFAHEARLHEIVLHIDNEKSRLCGIDGVEGMRTPRTLRYTLNQFGRDRELMHRLFSIYRNDRVTLTSPA